MEHYDWNEGWLFAPTFDPALVRPECPELSLTPVRLPHTVKPLPYNYCNENDYQRLCGYRREFFAPREWLGRNMAWLLRCIEAGKAAGIDHPQNPPRPMTNFIR